MTDFIASVAVENTTYSFDRIFDYAVGEEFANQIEIGKRVIVPFGRGNRKRQAIVFKLKKGETDSLKSILSVLDKSPVLTKEMVRLAVFMKDRYFCTFYDPGTLSDGQRSALLWTERTVEQPHHGGS